MSTGTTPVANSSRLPAHDGFLKRLGRALRQLFHETTGAIFAMFALAAANSAFRSWHSGVPRWIVALPVAYAVMMAFFSFTSFRSARRVR